MLLAPPPHLGGRRDRPNRLAAVAIRAPIVATADDIPASLDNQSFDVTGRGTLSLEQVAVPAPAFASIVGLTLLGIGLFWRRKEQARGTRIDTDESVVC